ncbi:MAG: hypothetical protein R3Y64_04035 [Peptostreptococcaceae bacterium]
MSKITLHAKFNKKCAFCTYWHDPTYSALEHKMGDVWIVDNNIIQLCMKVKQKRKSWNSCMDFESKMQ